MHRVIRVVRVGLLAGVFVLLACEQAAQMIARPEIRCGRFERADCNDLLELGLDAVAFGSDAIPLVIAVDGACPPNARCMPSALGGEEVAVIVRWPDGTVGWATIALPADWPASPPGPAAAQDEPPPPHLAELVGAGG